VTLLWLWRRPLLCVMFLWEQFSTYMVHHPTSPFVFVPFWTGSFLIVFRKRGPIPRPHHSPGLTPLDLFFWGFMKDNVYHEQSAKCEWVAWQLSELQSALRMNCVSTPVRKLNIVLMCNLPLMVPYWGLSTWHPVSENVSICPIYFAVGDI